YRGKEVLQSYLGYRVFLDLKEHTTSFDAMTPYYTSQRALGRGDATRMMSVGVSGPDLWRMFDVKPVIGRFFGDDDNQPTNPHDVLVLSYGFWQTQYGGHRDVLGQKVTFGPYEYTVIGVAPEGFSGFDDTAVIGFIP